MTEEQLDNFFTQIPQQIILSIQTNPDAWIKMTISILAIMGVTVMLWVCARHEFNNP